MKTLPRSSCTLPLLAWRLAVAGAFAFTLPAARSIDLPSKIFVSATGNDASDGARGTPKRTFQNAHDAVAPGGQIVVLDTAGYGALNITKSLAVTVPPGVNGFVTIPGDTIAIFVAAAATDVVSLRGLIVENSAASPGASYGVYASSVGTLTLEDCLVRNCGVGLFFLPGNAAQLFVHNTVVRGCTDGINVQPTGAFAYKALLTGCRVENNATGVAVFSAAAGSSVKMTLADCSVASSSNTNLYAEGGGASLRVDHCRVVGASAGVAAVSGAQLLSRGNNTLEDNNFANTFPGVYSPK